MMEITMSGVLVKGIGSHFGNLRAAKKILPRREKSARMVVTLTLFSQ